MIKKSLFFVPALALGLLTMPPAARPSAAADGAFVDALQSMMAELKPESRAAASRIKTAYGPMVARESFVNRQHLELALAASEVVRLPKDPLTLNLTPRVDGAHPIGEKDLAHQESYLGARPAALGLLYEIASRIDSNPVEVTSLVRHLQYQRALRATNANARTSVPTHAMGLAFDIALVNTPLATAYEIRDVLREMRDAGTLEFIGESRQLVFHVVPAREWIGYYEALYWAWRYASPPRELAAIAALPSRPIPPPPSAPLSPWEQSYGLAWLLPVMAIGIASLAIKGGIPASPSPRIPSL